MPFVSHIKKRRYLRPTCLSIPFYVSLCMDMVFKTLHKTKQTCLHKFFSLRPNSSIVECFVSDIECSWHTLLCIHNTHDCTRIYRPCSTIYANACRERMQWKLNLYNQFEQTDFFKFYNYYCVSLFIVLNCTAIIINIKYHTCRYLCDLPI